MEGVSSPSSGTFVSPLLLSPLQSLPTHSWYLITHCQGYSCCFQPLLLIPDLTSSWWDELQWPKLPDPAGLSSPYGKCWHSAPLSCRCCDTACSHIPKTLSTIILKAILFQISNHRNKERRLKKHCGLSKTIVLRKSSVQTCVLTAIKTLPSLCPPPLYPDFSLCSSSGQVSKSVFSFLK